MTTALFETLKDYGLETVKKATEAGIPIIIQSFDPNSLKAFGKLSDLPLIYLMFW